MGYAKSEMLRDIKMKLYVLTTRQYNLTKTGKLALSLYLICYADLISGYFTLMLALALTIDYSYYIKNATEE
jgi:hypothetical protein